jgi:hypothetical protein
MYGEVGVYLHTFNMEVRGQLQSPVALPLGKSPRYWVGLTTCLEAVEGKNLLPLPGIEPRFLSQP